MRKPKLTFEILDAKNKQFFVRCVHRNGNILFHSETYKRRSSAKNMVYGLEDGLVLEDFQIVDKTKRKGKK